MSENEKKEIAFEKIYLLIVLPLTLIFLFTSMVIVYAGLPYELDQIDVHMRNALETNNIDVKLGYLESTYIKLGVYHGNTGWLFPTERTDIDVAKELLLSAIEETTQQLNTAEKEQYMVLPHNELDAYIEENIKDTSMRIYLYKNAYLQNPTTNPSLWIGLFGLATAPFFMGIIAHSINKTREDDRWSDFWHNHL